MRIHTILSSRVDGPGLRVVLFMQGCSLGCRFCQNRHLWNAQGGKEMNVEDVAEAILSHPDYCGNVTITGGEPFEQYESLAFLTCILKQKGSHIIVYSGYTFEELVSNRKIAVFPHIDVLVDGRFIYELDNPYLSYRGNQRVIDIPQTLKTGQISLLDWDSPQVIVDPEGNLLIPQGLGDMFAEIGESHSSPRCGQTVRHKMIHRSDRWQENQKLFADVMENQAMLLGETV